MEPKETDNTSPDPKSGTQSNSSLPKQKAVRSVRFMADKYLSPTKAQRPPKPSQRITPRSQENPSRTVQKRSQPEMAMVPNKIKILNNTSRISVSSQGSGTVLNNKMDKDFTHMQTDFLLLKEHESKCSEIERKKQLASLVEGQLPQHLMNRYGKERGSVQTAIDMRPSLSTEEYRISNKSTPVVRCQPQSRAMAPSKLNCEIRTIMETEENHNLSGSYLIFGKEKVEAKFQKMGHKFLDFHLNKSNMVKGFGEMQHQFGKIEEPNCIPPNQIEQAKQVFRRKVKATESREPKLSTTDRFSSKRLIERALGTKVRSGSLKAKVKGLDKRNRSSQNQKKKPLYASIKKFARKYGHRVSTDESAVKESLPSSGVSRRSNSTGQRSMLVSNSNLKSLRNCEAESQRRGNDRNDRVGGESFLPYSKIKPRRKNYYDEYQIGVVRDILEESSIMRSGYDITFLKDRSHISGLSQISQQSGHFSRESNCARRNFQMSTKNSLRQSNSTQDSYIKQKETRSKAEAQQAHIHTLRKKIRRSTSNNQKTELLSSKPPNSPNPEESLKFLLSKNNSQVSQPSAKSQKTLKLKMKERFRSLERRRLVGFKNTKSRKPRDIAKRNFKEGKREKVPKHKQRKKYEKPKQKKDLNKGGDTPANGSKPRNRKQVSRNAFKAIAKLSSQMKDENATKEMKIFYDSVVTSQHSQSNVVKPPHQERDSPPQHPKSKIRKKQERSSKKLDSFEISSNSQKIFAKEDFGPPSNEYFEESMNISLTNYSIQNDRKNTTNFDSDGMKKMRSQKFQPNSLDKRTSETLNSNKILRKDKLGTNPSKQTISNKGSIYENLERNNQTKQKSWQRGTPNKLPKNDRLMFDSEVQISGSEHSKVPAQESKNWGTDQQIIESQSLENKFSAISKQNMSNQLIESLVNFQTQNKVREPTLDTEQWDSMNQHTQALQMRNISLQTGTRNSLGVVSKKIKGSYVNMQSPSGEMIGTGNLQIKNAMIKEVVSRKYESQRETHTQKVDSRGTGSPPLMEYDMVSPKNRHIEQSLELGGNNSIDPQFRKNENHKHLIKKTNPNRHPGPNHQTQKQNPKSTPNIHQSKESYGSKWGEKFAAINQNFNNLVQHSGDMGDSQTLKYQEIKHNINQVGTLQTLEPGKLQYQPIVINKITFQEHNAEPRSNLLSNQISDLAPNSHFISKSNSNVGRHSQIINSIPVTTSQKVSGYTHDLLCSDPASGLQSDPRWKGEMQVSAPFKESVRESSGIGSANQGDGFCPSKLETFRELKDTESKSKSKSRENDDFQEELFRVCPEPGLIQQERSVEHSEYIADNSIQFVKMVQLQHDEPSNLVEESHNVSHMTKGLSESDKTHLKKQIQQLKKERNLEQKSSSLELLKNRSSEQESEFYEREEEPTPQGGSEQGDLIGQFQKRPGNQDQYYEYVEGSDFHNSDDKGSCLEKITEVSKEQSLSTRKNYQLRSIVSFEKKSSKHQMDNSKSNFNKFPSEFSNSAHMDPNFQISPDRMIISENRKFSMKNKNQKKNHRITENSHSECFSEGYLSDQGSHRIVQTKFDLIQVDKFEDSKSKNMSHPDKPKIRAENWECNMVATSIGSNPNQGEIQGFSEFKKSQEIERFGDQRRSKNTAKYSKNSGQFSRRSNQSTRNKGPQILTGSDNSFKSDSRMNYKNQVTLGERNSKVIQSGLDQSSLVIHSKLKPMLISAEKDSEPLEVRNFKKSLSLKMQSHSQLSKGSRKDRDKKISKNSSLRVSKNSNKSHKSSKKRANLPKSNTGEGVYDQICSDLSLQFVKPIIKKEKLSSANSEKLEGMVKEYLKSSIDGFLYDLNSEELSQIANNSGNKQELNSIIADSFSSQQNPRPNQQNQANKSDSGENIFFEMSQLKSMTASQNQSQFRVEIESKRGQNSKKDCSQKEQSVEFGTYYLSNQSFHGSETFHPELAYSKPSHINPAKKSFYKVISEVVMYDESTQGPSGSKMQLVSEIRGIPMVSEYMDYKPQISTTPTVPEQRIPNFVTSAAFTPKPCTNKNLAEPDNVRMSDLRSESKGSVDGRSLRSRVRNSGKFSQQSNQFSDSGQMGSKQELLMSKESSHEQSFKLGSSKGDGDSFGNLSLLVQNKTVSLESKPATILRLEVANDYIEEMVSQMFDKKSRSSSKSGSKRSSSKRTPSKRSSKRNSKVSSIQNSMTSYKGSSLYNELADEYLDNYKGKVNYYMNMFSKDAPEINSVMEIQTFFENCVNSWMMPAIQEMEKNKTGPFAGWREEISIYTSSRSKTMRTNTFNTFNQKDSVMSSLPHYMNSNAFKIVSQPSFGEIKEVDDERRRVTKSRKSTVRERKTREAGEIWSSAPDGATLGDSKGGGVVGKQKISRYADSKVLQSKTNHYTVSNSENSTKKRQEFTRKDISKRSLERPKHLKNSLIEKMSQKYGSSENQSLLLKKNPNHSKKSSKKRNFKKKKIQNARPQKQDMKFEKNDFKINSQLFLSKEDPNAYSKTRQQATDLRANPKRAMSDSKQYDFKLSQKQNQPQIELYTSKSQSNPLWISMTDPHQNSPNRIHSGKSSILSAHPETKIVKIINTSRLKQVTKNSSGGTITDDLRRFGAFQDSKDYGQMTEDPLIVLNKNQKNELILLQSQLSQRVSQLAEKEISNSLNLCSGFLGELKKQISRQSAHVSQKSSKLSKKDSRKKNSENVSSEFSDNFYYLDLGNVGNDWLEYKGGLVHGKRHGFGIWTLGNGHRFEGHFNDGVAHGKGKYILGDEEELIGTWKNNVLMYKTDCLYEKQGVVQRLNDISFYSLETGNKDIGKHLETGKMRNTLD